MEIDGVDSGRQRGWSVVARGNLMQLDDDEMQYLRDSFDPGPWIQDRSAWLLLRCDSISGREIAGTDEWPFDDRAYL